MVKNDSRIYKKAQRNACESRRDYCVVGDKSPLAADGVPTKNGDGLLVSRRKSEEKRE